MRNIKRITEVMKIWNCKRALGLLKQIYRENLFSAVLSLIVIILLAVVGVMPSFLIGKIIDMAAAGRIDGLFMLNVGLILALGGGKILEIVQEYITAESSISVANSLTDRIMERLMHAETAWLSGQKRGEILQAVSDDVETVKRISVSTLPQFLYMLLVAVTSTVTIARVYYPVLLVAAIVYPLYLLPLGKNSRMQENAERSLRDVKAKSRGFIIETFENIKDIKIYGAEQASTEVFGGLQEQWSEDIKQKYVAVNMFKSVPRVLAALGPALVYIFAGIAVIHGNLSIGSVVTLAALLPKLSEPIRAYSGFYIDINVVEKIGEKFQQFLSAPREIQYDLPEREMAFDTVEFVDVSLKNERGTVLDGISFRIEKGEKIAIVGETGCGKTSLLKMIVGLVRPNAGTVMVGGENIAEINCRQLREHIRVILQENYVFDSSIVKNMGYLSDCSEAEIDGMCRALGLEEVVKSNAGDLGENLNTVSGGERQRINIGRSLLCPFDMLLMDEPTSELDPKMEETVMDFIFETAKERTVIYTAHKLKTLLYADKILYLKKGKIEDFGKTEEVIRRNRYFEKYTESAAFQDSEQFVEGGAR